MHVQKSVMPLPESITQSQVDALPQHVSIPLPQHQLIDPTHIVQPIDPKIQHRHLHLIMIHMQDLHQDLLM